MDIKLDAVVEGLGRPKVLVLGDLILDRYIWGNAERVSPEAPVLVLRAGEEEVRLGGAASVAALVAGLGGDVGLAGVIGADASGTVVSALLAEAGIESGAVLRVSERVTTAKDRFIGRAANRHPNQILSRKGDADRLNKNYVLDKKGNRIKFGDILNSIWAS